MSGTVLDQIPKEHRPTAAILVAASVVAIVMGATQFFLDPGDVSVSFAGSAARLSCRTVYSDWRGDSGIIVPTGTTPSQRFALEAGVSQWRRKCDDKRSQKVALGGGLIVVGAAVAGGGWLLLRRRTDDAPSDPLPSGQSPPPGWWWDGTKWNPPAS